MDEEITCLKRMGDKYLALKRKTLNNDNSNNNKRIITKKLIHQMTEK